MNEMVWVCTFAQENGHKGWPKMRRRVGDRCGVGMNDRIVCEYCLQFACSPAV